MIARVPYEGLSVEWINPSKFTLTLPWISLEVELEEENDKEWIVEAVQSLTKGIDSSNLQRFLGYFKDYPISYITPRNKINDNFVPEVSYIDNTLDLKSPKSLVKSITSNISQALIDLLPLEWEWPTEEVLNKSRINNTDLYDPQTAITYLIGKRLVSESLTDNIRRDLPKKLDLLRKNNEQKFFDVMKLIIRQTHYITRNFDHCVLPSISLFPNVKNVIKRFLNEEKGHDRLMVNALNELECYDPENIPVLDATIILMNLLEKSAKTSLLALISMIGFFEGSIYQDSDPLADVLARSSKPLSSKGYAIHYEINKKENHASILYELLKNLKYKSKNEVIYAMRFLELATILASSVNDTFYALSKGEYYEN